MSKQLGDDAYGFLSDGTGEDGLPPYCPTCDRYLCRNDPPHALINADDPNYPKRGSGMGNKLTDAELFQVGRRAVAKGQCSSVIVATDAEGIRNYHQCSGGSKHIGPTGHYCGCGEEWDQGTANGPLTDVAFGA